MNVYEQKSFPPQIWFFKEKKESFWVVALTPFLYFLTNVYLLTKREKRKRRVFQFLKILRFAKEEYINYFCKNFLYFVLICFTWVDMLTKCDYKSYLQDCLKAFCWLKRDSWLMDCFEPCNSHQLIIDIFWFRSTLL